MAAQLYFEDRAGQFARLNVSNVSTSQTLAYEHDSWTTQRDDETGDYIESMILWVSAPTTTVRRSLINRLQNLLNEADSPVNTCRVVEQTDGEGRRTATVLSGRLEPIADRVLHRDLTGEANRWALVFRRTPWEVSLQTETWHEASNYPATTAATLPDSLTEGNMAGRVETLSIAPNNLATGTKFWYGIKPAWQDISGFSPFIRVGRSATNDPHVWLSNDCQFADSNGNVAAPINAIGDYCLYTNFTQTTDLALRFIAPLRYWNEHTETPANRIKYVGEYLLVARMMVRPGIPGSTIDPDTIVAVQARTALGARGVGSTQEPVYVYDRANVWQMINLGRIRVGAGTWNRNIMELEGLGNFRVEILAQLVDGTAGASSVYFDNMFLVPAEYYVYVESPSTQIIDSGSRVDVITTERGDVAAFAASRTFVGGQGVESGTFPVYAQFSVELPTVEHNGWGIPFQRGSKFVYVMEDTQPNSTSGTSHITVIAAPRTHGYTPGT